MIKQHAQSGLWVSDQGIVFTFAVIEWRNGYAFVLGWAVHRLVAETFLGPRPSNLVTRHLNDVKADNKLDNLAYGTTADNVHDAIRNGRHPRRETHGRTRLTEKDVAAIRRRRKQGHKFQHIADDYRLSVGNVWQIVNHLTWK